MMADGTRDTMKGQQEGYQKQQEMVQKQLEHHQQAINGMAESCLFQIDGEPYWYYEYLIRKSPTKIAQEPNLYRRYVASTAERDGYLYFANASTLSKQWNNMGPFLEKTVASFRLNPPTENYVAPYKDPWRFW